MPLKRTRSITTTVMPTSGYQVSKKRKYGAAKRKPTLQLLSAPGTPFPTRCRAQLKYTSYVNLDPLTGTVAVQYVRCNSIYDPDATGVGGQPRGFDQYALLYDQYTVNSSKIKAWAVIPPGTGATAASQLFGISIVDATSTTPAIDNCADRPFTNYKIVHAYGAMKDQAVTSSWNRLKRFPKNDTYESLSAQIAANPQEQEYFQIWAYPALAPLTTDFQSFTVQYEVLYDVEFYELKQIPAS